MALFSASTEYEFVEELCLHLEICDLNIFIQKSVVESVESRKVTDVDASKQLVEPGQLILVIWGMAESVVLVEDLESRDGALFPNRGSFMISVTRKEFLAYNS